MKKKVKKIVITDLLSLISKKIDAHKNFAEVNVQNLSNSKNIVLIVTYSKLFFYSKTFEYPITYHDPDSIVEDIKNYIRECNFCTHKLLDFQFIEQEGFVIKNSEVNGIRFKFVVDGEDEGIPTKIYGGILNVTATVNNYDQYKIKSFDSITPQYEDTTSLFNEVKNKLTGFVLGTVDSKYSHLDPTFELKQLNSKIEDLEDQIKDLAGEIRELKEK